MNKIRLVGGKNIREARKVTKLEEVNNVLEAIELVKKVAFAKFDETLEVVVGLGVDPRHSDQMVRGVVSLPAGTGKEVRVAVICKDEKIDQAKVAGADLCGSEEILNEIKAGKINFDVCITTPDMMGVVGSVARILGPKGLMPNPKLGTVTTDITTAVKNAKSGQVEFRVDKAGIVHAGIGRVSFSIQDLERNFNSFIGALIRAKPAGAKGTYLKSIYISSTMGPSIKIETGNITV